MEAKREDPVAIDPPPSHDALSDLEWMRQRMSKDPAVAVSQPDPPLEDKIDIIQVCPSELIRCIMCSMTQPLKAGTLLK